jgi:hypothetical protein
MDYQFAYLFLSIAILAVIVIGFILLVPLAIIRHKIDYIKSHPFMFALETLLVGVLPTLPFLFFIYSRGYSFDSISHAMYVLAAKFAALHVLFEISGFYDYCFSK